MERFLLPDVKFPAGSSAMQRFGIVLWWFFLGIAAMALIAGLYGAVQEIATRGNDIGGSVMAGAGVAAPLFLIGRAALFILAGR